MNDRRPSRASSAFTLIELLVVVSIIAMLIAILLPALRQARAVSQQLACGSQQRQIGILLATYLIDNRDLIPSYAHANAAGTLLYNSYAWRMALDGLREGTSLGPPSITTRNSIFVDPSLPEDQWNSGPSRLGIGMNAALIRQVVSNPPPPAGTYPTGYAWPVAVYVQAGGLPASPPNNSFLNASYFRHGVMKHPSSTIYAGCTTDSILPSATNPWYRNQIGPSLTPTGSTGPYPLVDGQGNGVYGTRHLGGMNTVFNDGHVAHNQPDTLKQNIAWYWPGMP